MRDPERESCPPEFAAERCVHSSIEHASCCACVSACPPGALRLDDSSLDLDLEGCDGCGLCVSACPTAAITVNLPALEQTHGRGDRMLLACERSGLEDEHCVVPCIHALGIRELLREYRAGVRVLAVSIGDCDGCDRGSCVRLTERVQQVNLMLCSRRLPSMELIRVAVGAWQSLKGPHGSMRAGRRRFLRLAPAAVANEDDATLAPGAMLPEVSRTDVVPSVPVIDPRRCDGCDACIRLCPEGALGCTEVDGRDCYWTRPVRCTGCGICIDVCGSGAVRLQSWRVGQAAALPLTSGRCRACGAPYHQPESTVEGTGLCRICARVNHHRDLHQVHD